MWRRSISVLSVAVMAACQHNVVESGSTEAGMVEIRLAVDGMHDVRGILSDGSIETRITDVTLASYDSDGELVNVLYYESVLPTMSLYVSSKKPGNIYALANMGDMSDEFPVSESEVQGVSYMLESYDDVADKGFPMCGVLEGCAYEKDVVRTVELERLFAKLNVRILHTGLTGSSQSTIYAMTLCNRSLYLRQANRRLLPFSREGSRSLSESDVMALSDYYPDLADYGAYEGSLSQSSFGPGVGYVQDTTVFLYVPENVQGVLLPGNTDPLLKIDSRISDVGGKSYEELCTYLEFNAEKANSGLGYYGDVSYRCYLGEDNASDFSVRRNSSYDLTLNLTDDGFFLDSWKVVRGEDWTDTRTLYFLDDTNLIYPGTTSNVMVHYNRYSKSSDIGSTGHAQDIAYEIDDAAMKSAGLTCTFMGNEMVAGENGYNDLYFKVTASSDAKVGTSIPMTVSMADGSKSDRTVINVARIGDLTSSWKFHPQYVSQTGELQINGAISSQFPLSVTVSDPSVASCVKVDDTSFKVTCLREGETDLIVSNVDKTQTLTIPFDVSAPVLKISDINIALAPDGKSGDLDYAYVDEYGDAISNVDETAYRQYLLPAVSGCDFLAVNSGLSSIEMYIDKLTSSGVKLSAGSYHDISVAPSDCPGVRAHKMRVYVINPFEDISVNYSGRLDDYTLFGLSGVPAAVRSCFSDFISNGTSIKYEVPQVDAERIYVSSSLEPAWTEFSYDNQVWSTSYNHSDAASSLGASVTVSQKVISATTKHSAGRHRLRLHVKNRYSGEYLSKNIGTMDVYVHTAIGAEGVFGSLVCSYPSGGASSTSTVAGIYNSISGMAYYNPTSSNKIYYMDVYMRYLTDVSNVYVFKRMESAVSSYQNQLDALDVVGPSVTDGYADLNQRLLYSVCTDRGQRIAICGEPYGMRKGIGTMLYRALTYSTYMETLPESRLRTLFLGSSLGTGMASYAPRYEIHDMNKGSDMTTNVVSKNQMYYFSPSAYSGYRDSAGRGYHVIHPLGYLIPSSYGWINLL